MKTFIISLISILLMVLSISCTNTMEEPVNIISNIENNSNLAIILNSPSNSLEHNSGTNLITDNANISVSGHCRIVIYKGAETIYDQVLYPYEYKELDISEKATLYRGVNIPMPENENEDCYLFVFIGNENAHGARTCDVNLNEKTLTFCSDHVGTPTWVGYQKLYDAKTKKIVLDKYDANRYLISVDLITFNFTTFTSLSLWDSYCSDFHTPFIRAFAGLFRETERTKGSNTSESTIPVYLPYKYNFETQDVYLKEVGMFNEKSRETKFTFDKIGWRSTDDYYDVSFWSFTNYYGTHYHSLGEISFFCPPSTWKGESKKVIYDSDGSILGSAEFCKNQHLHIEGIDENVSEQWHLGIYTSYLQDGDHASSLHYYRMIPLNMAIYKGTHYYSGNWPTQNAVNYDANIYGYKVGKEFIEGPAE